MTILEPNLKSMMGDRRSGPRHPAGPQTHVSSGRRVGPTGPTAGPGVVPRTGCAVGSRPLRGGGRRPNPARPQVAPLRYRGSGIAVSRADHPLRPVRTSVAVALGAMTALITLWLGLLAQFSGDQLLVGGSPASTSTVPDRLGVVRVQPGESLGQLAARVAPLAPAEEVVDRIRDLNKLDSGWAVSAGRTLIAPLG